MAHRIRRTYVNFYAYRHTVVEKHITTILDTLQESGPADNTIILRIAQLRAGHWLPLDEGGRESAYRVDE